MSFSEEEIDDARIGEYKDVPSDHVYTIMQNHGREEAGWGPAAVVMPMLGDGPRPVIYSGNNTGTIMAMSQIAKELATRSGKETRLVRFSEREDIATFGGNDEDR